MDDTQTTRYRDIPNRLFLQLADAAFEDENLTEALYVSEYLLQHREIDRGLSLLGSTARYSRSP